MKKKIELGVYTNPYHSHQDWLYQDIYPYPNVDIVCDAISLPIESNSMEEVYASHIIEHFYFDDARSAIKEWLRILQPGGKLTIVLPDFAKVWEMVINHEKPKFMDKYVDTVEDWAARLMSNDRNVPHSHRNHYPYYWYEETISKMGCQVSIERVYRWVVPEVIVSVIKL